ncbi:MAG TPA: nucleotide exchange factor GrpE [Thermoleophilaceae bacterium]
MTAFDDQEHRGAGVPPADEPVTARDEAGEPAGEERASNEAERVVETERAAGTGAGGAGSPEPASAAGEVVDGEAVVDEPEDELARAQRERDEYLDLARRAQADFENYRKRAAREAAAAGERARGGLVRELLPVVDNLERALLSAADGEQHLAEGVRLVHSELVAVLERNGVEQFDPSGEVFDPTVHEALSTRAQEGAQPGVVLDVVEKGYRTNGNVLRPARVIVSG